MHVEYQYPAWPPYGLISMSLNNDSCFLYSSDRQMLSILETKNINIYVLVLENKLEIIRMEVSLQG